MTGAETDAAEAAAPGYCTCVEDFFTPAARDLIGRFCRTFLDQYCLTPTELLHSPEHQNKLDSLGPALRGAVERAAAHQAEASGGAITSAARIKELYALFTDLRRHTMARKKAVVPAPVGTVGFVEAVSSVVGDSAGPDGDLAVNLGLTEHLRDCRSWSEKVDRVLGLIEDTVDQPHRPYAEDVLAEQLESAEAVDDVVGRPKTLDVRLHHIVDLLTQHPVAEDEMTPVMARMVRLGPSVLSDKIRHSLMRSFMRGLAEPERLIPASAADLLDPQKTTHRELTAVCALLRRLETDSGILGGERVETLFEKRFSRLISPESLVDILRGRPLVERLQILLDLRAVVIGSAQAALISEELDRAFENPDLRTRLAESTGNPMDRVRALGALDRALGAAPLPDDRKSGYRRMFADIQHDVIRREQVFARIEKSLPDSAKKGLYLLDLLLDGAFTAGQNTDTVRKLIRHYMNQPDFLSAYVAGIDDGQDKSRALAVLKNKMAAAGLTPAK